MQRNRSRLLALLRHIAGPVYPLPRRLTHCEHCHSGYVNPVMRHEHDDATWWIRLRCGECGFVREVEASDEEARRFDAELDGGVREIATAMARLQRQRTRVEADAVIAALNRDRIDPSTPP